MSKTIEYIVTIPSEYESLRMDEILIKIYLNDIQSFIIKKQKYLDKINILIFIPDALLNVLPENLFVSSIISKNTI